MPEETDAPPHGTGLPAVGEIVPEHAGFTPCDRQEAGAESQQGRLPGPVGPAEEHDLAGSDVQVDPGQCGEPAQ